MNICPARTKARFVLHRRDLERIGGGVGDEGITDGDGEREGLGGVGVVLEIWSALVLVEIAGPAFGEIGGFSFAASAIVLPRFPDEVLSLSIVESVPFDCGYSVI